MDSLLPPSTIINHQTKLNLVFSKLVLTMFSSAPAKILIGVSTDLDESRHLLSWAVNVLAHPNDTIVTLHVLGEVKKKSGKASKRQSQLRRAKAYVISVLGEFAQICRSKQVNLEGKVGFSSSIGRGLMEEVKFISADYLLLSGSRIQSHKTSRPVTRYCLEQAPEACTVVSVGKSSKPPQYSHAFPAQTKENCQSSSRWSDKSIHSSRSSSPVASPVTKQANSVTKSNSSSPKTVLDCIEAESHSTEYDTYSFGDSTMTESSSTGQKSEIQSTASKKLSTCKLFSFFRSPLIKRIGSPPDNKKQQPLFKCFSYEELLIATNNFHSDNIIGRGGYSEVYQGTLSDGRTIAIKRLTKDDKDAKKEKEFLMELGIIGHVNHPNAASLVGCCIENGLYLILNFSRNGNLASALHGKTCQPLDWPVRYKIATGVARGLHYLHKCCKRRIIHRDIKASNVLLGPNYEPQITDFGLAKWLPNKWTHHAAIPIEGTFGYLAPEYFMHGIVDEKTDVFAFGVLLMEIVTGRRPVDSSRQNLLMWAKPFMESGNLSELADPKLGGIYDPEQMNRLVLTASYCVRQSSVSRPSMIEVLELLTSGHETHDLQVTKSSQVPPFTSDELDDYSMIFGYDIPSDIDLEDYL